ncbi:SDR family NAD(P)-dependent oxidoreductase [Spirillospora sp. NPDC048911]|uniref:SDR family NAD(P)-dependent oxidoreductase n=1 Tax=Spirillospora sp. NPDC048911 TaxID=3364527 RepID=UPI0037248BF1
MTAPWAVVTGASSGIGLAIAEHLLKDGHRVAAWARRGDRLTELVERYGAEQIRMFQVDVRDAAAVQAAVAELTRDGAEIGLLVNNAGLSLGLGPLDEGDTGDWHTMVQTNIEGLLACTHAVMPGMRAAGRGHIVNIGSLAAEFPFLGGNVYAGTKAFVHHLTANLRVDLHGSGVRVTCVAPGMVRSEFAVVRFGGDQELADALYEGIQPLTPADVADAVVWAHRCPPNVNVNHIELMSLDQPYGLSLSRRKDAR